MLTRRSFLSATLAGAIANGQRPAPPNIVVILADDLGYGDVGCYNRASRIPTPHLDSLAAAGIRFTDAHTPSAVCTPTRYGLLTGRYAWRTRLKSGVLDGFDPPLIEDGRLTIASFLKKQGYETACVGKWHLGMGWTNTDGSPVAQREATGFRPGYDVDYRKPVTGGPLSQGFDYFFGISASLDMSPYCFIENDRTVGVPKQRTPEVKDLFFNQVAGVTTPEFELNAVLPECVRKASEFIGKKRSTPFFLYMPLTAPHLPVVPNEKFKGKSKAGLYGDFVVEVDDAAASVVAALERSGVRENTLILFTSDNGGLWHWWQPAETDDLPDGAITARGRYVKDFGHAGNAQWRGTKADIWEGGHRVPFIVNWPARVKTAAVCHHLVCLTDLIATCAEVTGVSLPQDTAMDSISFLGSIQKAGTSSGARSTAILHSSRGAFAVRHGDWKYMPSRGSGGFTQPASVAAKAGEPTGQLYDLRTDPAETTNLFPRKQDVAKHLEGLLQQALSGPGTRDAHRR